MKKLLYFSLVLIIGVSILSLYRFGPTLECFFKGDGNAVLEAASALIGIWALVVGFSATVIGATFELSKLPSHWKLKLLRTQISKRIRPFFILTLICGIIPFIAIFNTDTSVGVYNSPVTAWLILGFILQILLIWSAAKAAFLAYEELTLIPAIKTTLDGLGDDQLNQLKNLHNATFKADYDERKGIRLIPMSGLGRGLSGEGADIHDELVTLLITLFRETDPQTLDKGVRLISEWAKNKSLKEIDGYLQYRLIPSFFHMMNTAQDSLLSTVFKSRLYYFAELINALRESGTTLTASNVANPLWDIINEFARHNSMSNALEHSEIAINTLLANERKNKEYSILLQNLSGSIAPLVAEHNTKSIFWIYRILELQELHIKTFFGRWPEMREQTVNILIKMEDIYEYVEKGYGSTSALCADLHDIRYWILIILRRLQEAFVAAVPPEKIEPNLKEAAAKDFDYFEEIIRKLLEIRTPNGEPESYSAIKYKNNPYV